MSLRWTLCLQSHADDGSVETIQLGAVERPTCNAEPADFGLSLRELRPLALALQQTVAQQQIYAYDRATRRCPHCGAAQRLDPIEELILIVFVPGLQIPLDPANVLWRTRPTTRHATWQPTRMVPQHTPLHTYLVVPPRVEVIHIDEAFVFAEMKRGQRQFVCHCRELQDALTSFAVTPATNAERVQMFVGPAHDDLDDMVQLSERQVLGNEDASPNRRA